MVRAFYKAYQLRQKKVDEEAWLYGAYVYKALQSALSVSEFFRGKNQKPEAYPEKPLMAKEEERKTEEVKAKEAEFERLRLVAYLNAVRDEWKRKESL